MNEFDPLGLFPGLSTSASDAPCTMMKQVVTISPLFTMAVATALGNVVLQETITVGMDVKNKHDITRIATFSHTPVADYEAFINAFRTIAFTDEESTHHEFTGTVVDNGDEVVVTYDTCHVLDGCLGEAVITISKSLRTVTIQYVYYKD